MLENTYKNKILTLSFWKYLICFDRSKSTKIYYSYKILELYKIYILIFKQYIFDVFKFTKIIIIETFYF